MRGEFAAIRFFVYRVVKFSFSLQFLIFWFSKKEFDDNNENECFSSEASALCASENGASHFWYILDILSI